MSSKGWHVQQEVDPNGSAGKYTFVKVFDTQSHHPSGGAGNLVFAGHGGVRPRLLRRWEEAPGAIR
ncbi:MAG: hypothetical protein ACOY9Y_12990 [Bacillota bacterium]